jgi:signal transduction histidine kinase
MARPEDPDAETAAAASPAELKAYGAEKNIAWVRLAVILFNIAAYWGLLYPAQPGSPALAAFVTVVALAYAVLILAAQPYRRFPILATAAWTAATDGTLITLWLHATGDFASPFHLLWFLSLFAVTFRYDGRATLAASVLYGAAYWGLLWATGTLAGHGTEVLVRVVYILLVGVLGSLLARESLRVFEERYRLGQTVQESRRLRDLAEASPEALAIAADGVIVEANRAYCDLVGRPRGEILGTPVPAAFPAGATDEQGVETWVVGAGGRRLIRAVANPLEFQGRPALFAALRDVTQERAAQEARETALKTEMEVRRLREVDRFKSEFINAAAHELNTPLTPLKIQLHILKKRLPKDSSLERRTIDLLDRNLERLVGLVEEMLDVARLNSGRLRLRPVAADLAKLLRDSAETFQGAAAQRGLALRLDAPPTLPGVLDPQRVTQVLYNLLSNALKFTPQGGSVAARARRDGAWLEVEVADTGAGLTPEQAERLFQPFARLHRDQLDAPGTGLGLYISQGIAQRHGGTLTVRSAGAGQGATFTLRLPESPPAAAAAEPGPGRA